MSATTRVAKNHPSYSWGGPPSRSRRQGRGRLRRCRTSITSGKLASAAGAAWPSALAFSCSLIVNGAGPPHVGREVCVDHHDDMAWPAVGVRTGRCRLTPGGNLVGELGDVLPEQTGEQIHGAWPGSWTPKTLGSSPGEQAFRGHEALSVVRRPERAGHGAPAEMSAKPPKAPEAEDAALREKVREPHPVRRRPTVTGVTTGARPTDAARVLTRWESAGDQGRRTRRGVAISSTARRSNLPDGVNGSSGTN